MYKNEFHTRLVMALTSQDRKESKRKGYNIYALAQYFIAAEDVTDAKSFSEAFTPTSGMHQVAKTMGFDLDVERGRWITKESK